MTLISLPTVAVTPGADGPARPPAIPTVDVVVPVYNEAHVLDASVRRLHAHLAATMPFPWRITIADNASTDGTGALAQGLAAELPHVRSLCLDRKGRGLALKAAWSSSDAVVVAYTDVDLSTDLDALLPLVAPLVSGHSDVAIGSRLAPGSQVARGPRREAISRAYNLLLRTVFAARFSDAQCGFKAIRADAAAALLPEIEDDGWFFDTELLLLADHNDLRIHEVAVDWVDDPDSRVEVFHTAIEDLEGVARMVRRFARGQGHIDDDRYHRDRVEDDMGRQLVVFSLIGTASTAVSLGIFLATRGVTGAVVANALAVSATAVANVWANRRYTFGRRGRHGRTSRSLDYRTGALVYLGGLTLSTGALVAVDRLGGGGVAEVLALLGAWAVTALARFGLLRRQTRATSRATDTSVDRSAHNPNHDPSTDRSTNDPAGRTHHERARHDNEVTR
jgi:putative flippase GtrA